VLFGASKVIESVVFDGRSLSQAFEGLDSKARPAIQSVVYQALRGWAIADTLITQYILKKPSKELHSLLSLAIALVFHQERGTGQNQYSVPTIVNEAVKSAALSPKTKHAQGLINAVLRKVAKRAQDQNTIVGGLGIPYPAWWLAKIQAAYPNAWKTICAVQEKAPPLTLRVNTQKNTRQEYCAILDALGIAHAKITELASLQLETALVICKPIPVAQLPGFTEGAVSVQDAGAQLAPLLLQPQPDERILDACAAPGGKTAHLIEQAALDRGTLTALELDPERSKKMNSTIKRLQLQTKHLKVITGDASKQDWWDGILFDKILLDVPCSASGIVRRHPDIVFLRREQDIAHLVKTQRAILENAWQMLSNGGLLLYVTCSIFPEEGEGQIHQFVKGHPNALRLEAPGQLLPQEQHDGFFYGLLKKMHR
jgi:16S rRNA (cytosine967-C5)-methyltransferase